MNMMAAVDAKYRFIWTEFGSWGSNNDAFVFNTSSFCRMMERRELNFPAPSLLPKSDVKFPYFVVGDNGFGIRKWLMIPYAQGRTAMTIYEHEYNYR